LSFFAAKVRKEDLVVSRGPIEAGRDRLIIGRTSRFGEIPEAIRYLEAGHSRGKVVIAV
jgi:hypothetical protein